MQVNLKSAKKTSEVKFKKKKKTSANPDYLPQADFLKVIKNSKKSQRLQRSCNRQDESLLNNDLSCHLLPRNSVVETLKEKEFENNENER
ncbi:hypothetical protein ASF10_14135 [Flavobacterium sp. Leaf82]|nr:hypothetical protein ASF10_14135 [Flavobacterium sp. Leaf82]